MIIHICGPSYHCRWRDDKGKPWFMDWTAMGPVFSADNFRDGGVNQNDVPVEILKNAEAWAKKILKQPIILVESPDYDYC